MGHKASVALFTDEAALGGERRGRQRDGTGCKRRHLDVAAGEGVAGVLDELGQGQDGRDQGVVEQRRVAGPDSTNVFFSERIQQR